MAMKTPADGDLIYDALNLRSVSSGTETVAGSQVVTGTLAVTGAQTLTGATALNGGATVATTKTLAVTDADKLTVGGIIVPQYFDIVFNVKLHASTVIYNIYNAPRACTVVGITYTTNVAQAITATLVKSTVNATPASATTPLHIAGAISANTTVHNGTTVTLTVTAADLTLAATDKIGLVLSGALTTGDFTVNIRLKYA
jgi:hypothetical protein